MNPIRSMISAGFLAAAVAASPTADAQGWGGYYGPDVNPYAGVNPVYGGYGYGVMNGMPYGAVSNNRATAGRNRRSRNRGANVDANQTPPGPVSYPYISPNVAGARFSNTPQAGVTRRQNPAGSRITGSMAGQTGASMPNLGTSVPHLNSSSPFLFTAVPQLGPGVPQLGYGVPQLGMGVPQLGAGVPQLGTGVPQLGAGVPQLGAGVPQLGTGSPRLDAAVPQLNPKASRYSY